MLLLMPIAGQVSGRFQPKYLITIGLLGIALSMWYSTSLTPDASFGYFAWVRVYQTLGLPFLFIPINTVAYDGLPRDKTNQASALMNVARNLGGSIGISLANVEITQRTQLHQSRLVENTIPSSPVFQSTLHGLSQYFVQHGAAPGAANSEAIGFMGHLVQTQATILAYIDVFHLCSVVAALMIPIVLIMVRRVQLGHGAPAAGH
jgi:DHA2 family multidrug resistance protein